MHASVDHFFTIGKDHSKFGIPCQDHALSNIVHIPDQFHEFNGYDYEEASVVISDGCSGAGEGYNPDMGARVITQTYLRHAKGCCATGAFPSNGSFIDNLDAVKPSFLANEDMLASLIGVTYCRDKIKVNWIGDGVVITKSREGKYHYWSLAFPYNTPLYPINLVDEKSHADYAAYMKGLDLIVTEMDFTIEEDKVQVSKVKVSPIKMDIVVKQGFSLLFEASEISDVYAFSDGLEQFSIPASEEATEPYPVQLEVLKEFLAIKNHTPGFVTRRCLRALETLAKKGIVPCDDFSMVALHVE